MLGERRPGSDTDSSDEEAMGKRMCSRLGHSHKAGEWSTAPAGCFLAKPVMWNPNLGGCSAQSAHSGETVHNHRRRTLLGNRTSKTHRSARTLRSEPLGQDSMVGIGRRCKRTGCRRDGSNKSVCAGRELSLLSPLLWQPMGMEKYDLQQLSERLPLNTMEDMGSPESSNGQGSHDWSVLWSSATLGRWWYWGARRQSHAWRASSHEVGFTPIQFEHVVSGACVMASILCWASKFEWHMRPLLTKPLAIGPGGSMTSPGVFSSIGLFIGPISWSTGAMCATCVLHVRAILARLGATDAHTMKPRLGLDGKFAITRVCPFATEGTLSVAYALESRSLRLLLQPVRRETGVQGTRNRDTGS